MGEGSTYSVKYCFLYLVYFPLKIVDLFKGRLLKNMPYFYYVKILNFSGTEFKLLCVEDNLLSVLSIIQLYFDRKLREIYTNTYIVICRIYFLISALIINLQRGL